jgi:rubrerythrin
MQKDEMTLLDAITTAKEFELQTSHYYLDAALKTGNPKGIALFKGLADLERQHYDALIKLENSLRAREVFRGYKVMNAPLEGWGFDDSEIEPNNLELIEIIDLAIEKEEKAENVYNTLPEQTTNADARDLFNKLAAEERFHIRVLNAARTSLKVNGTWKFSFESLSSFD